MVAQRPMPKVRVQNFAGVKPRMHCHEVVDRAAPFFHRGERMVIRMCHRRPLRNHG